MTGQKKKEKELKNLMVLEKHIETAIKNAEIHLEILTLAAKKCIAEQWKLKEELRVR